MPLSFAHFKLTWQRMGQDSLRKVPCPATVGEVAGSRSHPVPTQCALFLLIPEPYPVDLLAHQSELRRDEVLDSGLYFIKTSQVWHRNAPVS